LKRTNSIFSKNYYKIIVGVLIFLSISMLPVMYSHAASKITLIYDGKTVSYTGKQASVAFNKATISLEGTPGILINDYALLPYKDVFENKLGASCSYNSKKQEITISQNNISIQMTLGSTTAYVNNKAVQLNTAPRKVTYVEANKSAILVPSRFVAEALGYTYSWDNANSKIDIQSPWRLYYDGAWNIYKDTRAGVSFDGTKVNVSNMPGILVQNVVLLQAKKVFHDSLGADYNYNKTSKTITLSKNGNTIQMILDSNVATVNNKTVTMDTKAYYIKNETNGKGYIMVPGSFVAQHLGYSYRWDSKSNTAVIKTSVPTGQASTTPAEKAYLTWSSNLTTVDGKDFTNLIKQVTALNKNKTDIITIEGLSLPNATIVEDNASSCLYVDIPNTYYSFGDKSKDISNGICMKGVSISYIDGTTTRITIQIAENTEYYTSTSGNSLSLYLTGKSKNTDTSLKIMKPAEVSFSAITNVDQYYKKKFVISIPGNYVDYYNVNPIITANSAIKNITVAYDNAGTTNITVTTTKLQGYKLYDKGSYFTVKVGNPKDIYQNIVVLDAGHGGKDPGAQKSGYKEKDINYQIIYEKAKQYFDSPESTVKAYWTRTDDTFISLDNRAAFAKEIGADLFISLHENMCGTASVSGFEVYYSTLNNKKNKAGLNSYQMATIFCDNLKSTLDMSSHGTGVKSAKFIVVHKNTVPSILIELGFMSNASDLDKMTDEEFQDAFAKTLYDSTVSVFENYPTGR
jgi:N-acetylmuramoyl-L-alanine amidase